MDKKFAKQKIQELLDKYDRIVSEGKLKSFNEEMTKKDFILPLFSTQGEHRRFF